MKGKARCFISKLVLSKNILYFWKRDVIFNLFMNLSLDILLMLSTAVHFFFFFDYVR